jgi:methyl-accepting chemotaxis protein
MLEKLVPDIQQTAALVQEISRASTDQSSGTNEIGRAMGQLDMVVQKNASSAEEMAATAGQLHLQAVSLNTNMAYFNTDEAGGDGFDPLGQRTA